MYLSDRVCYISPSFSCSLFSKFLIISQAGGGGKRRNVNVRRENSLCSLPTCFLRNQKSSGWAGQVQRGPHYKRYSF